MNFNIVKKYLILISDEGLEDLLKDSIEKECYEVSGIVRDEIDSRGSKKV